MQTITKIKKIGALLLCANMLVFSTGCNETSKKLEEMEPLSIAEVALKENDLSGISTEQAVYNYLSNTISLSSSHLVKASDSDLANIETAVGLLNKYLATGKSAEEIISEDLANYMLWEFCSLSPYSWQYSSSQVLGYDAATRLYFVDVTYETTGENKSLFPKSRIVQGDTSYESKMQQRFSEYNDILMAISSDLKNAGKTFDPFTAGTLVNSNNAVANESTPVSEDVPVSDENTDTAINDAESVDIPAVASPAVSPADNNSVNSDVVTLLAKTYQLPIDDPSLAGSIKPETYNKIKAFEDTWGLLSTILPVQSNSTLLDKLKACNLFNETKIGQFGFPGVAEVERDMKSAKVTFRMILDYSYLWGTEQGFKVQKLYLKDFTNESAADIEAKYTNDKASLVNGYSDFISKKINSYYTSVSTANHYGLNKLFLDYGAFDLNYELMSQNTFRSFKGFQKEIIGLSDNIAAVKVTTQHGLSGKGASMSLPTYQSESILLIALTNSEELKVVGEIPLTDTLIGEPLSVVRNISGVSDQLMYTSGSFSKQSEQGVMEALGSFVQLELEGDITASSPHNVVNLGISSTAYSILQNNITDLKNLEVNESYTFVQNWSDKSNTYCVVKLREIYLGSSCSDTESTISLVNSEDGWKVINYVRTKTNSFVASGIPEDLAKSADFHVVVDGSELKLETKSVTVSEDTSEEDFSEDSEDISEE